MSAENFRSLGKGLGTFIGRGGPSEDTASTERLRARRGINDLGADNELNTVRFSLAPFFIFSGNIKHH
jgi:hypothetical protein